MSSSKIKSVKEFTVTKHESKDGLRFKICNGKNQEVIVPFCEYKSKNNLLKLVAQNIESCINDGMPEIYVYIIKVQNTNKVGIVGMPYQLKRKYKNG